MTPLEFLNDLWRYKPEEQFILIWTQPDKRSRWFSSVEAAAEYVGSVNGSRDVYVGVGLAGKEYGPARRCASDEITSIAGICSDLDLLSDAHKGKPLPRTIEQALSILPTIMQPTLIILTGNGLQCWWLLKEPYVFENVEDRKSVARLVTRWHTLLRLNAAARGWVYDRLSDLARVLRVPGTRNHKDPAHPKDVKLHSRKDVFYNLSDFEEFLDAAGIPDPEAEERAAREWKERFADKPLVINPDVCVPQELLDTWMGPSKVDPQIALKFRNTWHHQRHDLKDQSGSGYDMALADFGVDAGLSEQQIVDLIIHHRRHHNTRPRTTLDYYQRTIAKAEQRSDWRDESSAVPAAVGPLPTTGPVAPPGASVAPDEPSASETTTPPTDAARDADSRRKALLCERISVVLTVPVVRLVKITGKEPQYRMELAGGQKIEFSTVRKLLTYMSVYDAIAATFDKCIPKIKSKLWDQLKQVFLDACIPEEGTEEMQWEGAARLYLQQYLAETGFIPCIEGQRIQDQRRPMVIDGAITVCASDLQTYINKTSFQALSVKAVAGMLSALGAKSTRVRGVKFKDQSRWRLPQSEFEPNEYQPSEGGCDHC